MTTKKDNTIGPLILVVVLAALGGLSLLKWGSPVSKYVNQKTDRKPIATEKLSEEALDPLDQRTMLYARAIQTCDCDTVINMTLWMQERLDYVLQTEGTPEASDKARQDLCDDLCDRTLEGRQLLPEGVEDQYLFAPGVEFYPVSTDEGLLNLAAPAATRTWIRVEYPSEAIALRDPKGLPIKALTVGINITAGGSVLKAGVIGNVEIDWDSISYTW